MESNPIRYFYDTEFVDDGRTIDLVSIGMIAVPNWAIEPERGVELGAVARRHARTYYAVNAEANMHAVKSDDWLVRNVLPHLPLRHRDDLETYIAGAPNPDELPIALQFVNLDRTATEVKPKWVIANEVRDFILAPFAEADDDEPVTVELWADYAAYDHVALAQLWGPMKDLPTGIPMYTNDLQQYRRAVGSIAYAPDRDPDGEHHALADAWADVDLFAGLRHIERNSK